MKVKVYVELSVPPNKRHLQEMRNAAQMLTDNKGSISISGDYEEKLAIAEFTMTKARQVDVSDRIMRCFRMDMPDYETQSVCFPRSDAEERKVKRANERARERRAAASAARKAHEASGSAGSGNVPGHGHGQSQNQG